MSRSPTTPPSAFGAMRAPYSLGQAGCTTPSVTLLSSRRSARRLDALSAVNSGWLKSGRRVCCVDRDGDRWHVDETYVKVTGRWVYLYRAVDQFGQVIDVYASTRRDSEAAHGFFERARKATGVVPMEVIPL